MNPTARALADDYVRRFTDLDARAAAALGTHPGDDRMPDLTPAGQHARDDLDRSVLSALAAADVRDDDDRRCARLLRERLEAQLALSASGLRVPPGSPVDAGATWTRESAREFPGGSGRPPEFLDSEVVRYLGWPGQAISYKLGERAWLAGRDAARAAHGPDFDLKAWHAAALAQGCLGLDDLTDELARL